MTPIDDNDAASKEPDDMTGLPLFKTWPAVYAFVLGAFLLMVVLLSVFTFYFTRVSK